jgi:cell wall-associated NlpC family hydrolase
LPSDLTPFAERLLPARPDLAAEHLRGRVPAERFAAGMPARVTAPLLDLFTSTGDGAERATQLLYGEAFVVYEQRDDGLAWGQARLDGYVGYVDARHLGPPRGRGRRVTALWSHVYRGASVRAQVLSELPYLAEVPASGSTGGFTRLRDGGHVPSPHLARPRGDFVAEAERFIGAPYLWGGRSVRGLDCSALVQLALLASGHAAPRDSDMQAAMLGTALDAATPPARGDLLFWKGHVGMLTDPGTLLHANAHHMAVVVEPLAPALARIRAAGGGDVLVRRRLASIRSVAP